jgi:hypothetical protein
VVIETAPGSADVVRLLRYIVSTIVRSVVKRESRRVNSKWLSRESTLVRYIAQSEDGGTGANNPCMNPSTLFQPRTAISGHSDAYETQGITREKTPTGESYV